MKSLQEQIEILIAQAKCYVVLARTIQSDYYLSRARATMALARSLQAEMDSDKTVELRLVA